ncbi:MAG: hemerythrin domain-containing protein [Candidatus Sedimenticola endophacoides]
MFLVWDDAFNTGVEVIDHQHRRLVQLINALYGAKVNHDAGGVADVMDQLVEYTVGHFASANRHGERSEGG